MTIRKTVISDLDEICRIYSEARDFMRETGNHKQWTDGHPSRETALRDIQNEKSYVCMSETEVAAVFYYAVEPDPTYGKIDGEWLSNDDYGVVHRIARARNVTALNPDGSTVSIGAFCLDWCLKQCGNLRIDTHEDNAPMRRLLEKMGFSYCGIIWLENGDERMAFQKIIAPGTPTVSSRME